MDEEFAPYEEMTTSSITDEYSEHSHLRPHYINDEELSYFQQLHIETVRTNKGDIAVAVQGDRTSKRPALLTLHDIGQDHVKCFQSYFCFHQVKPLLNHFTVYHINFPGQQEGAKDLEDSYMYPSMEEMGDVVSGVVDYLGIKKPVCMGVGAGGNIFTRLALKRPNLVDCLILVNGSCATSSWSDWGYEKMSSHYLKTKGMTNLTLDYLINHHFGKNEEKRNPDLVALVRDQLHNVSSPKNLGLFIESYSKRDAIKITRPTPGQQSRTSLKCGTLLITGDCSPVLEETIALNSKLDPSNSSWIKIPNATGLVLEEQPVAVTNALVLFLQGHGYVMKLHAPALPTSVDEMLPR